MAHAKRDYAMVLSMYAIAALKLRISKVAKVLGFIRRLPRWQMIGLLSMAHIKMAINRSSRPRRGDNLYPVLKVRRA